MERVWLISNEASGSADAAKCAALEAVFEERGLALAGRTMFPGDPLPDTDALEAARVDTVVLFAGDGTINAAACKYDRWGGAALILPGGTMNLLAKQLHGDADPHAIVHAAHQGAATVKMPFVEAGPHRAFVGLIAGPAASWARAREIVRKGALRRLRRAIRYAWTRSWSDSVWIYDVRRVGGRYAAVIIEPRRDGKLSVAGISAERWSDIARLGWEWLKGDWHAAPAVDANSSGRATIVGRRAITALFDGEEVKLVSPIKVASGMSELSFVRTVEPDA